MFKWLAALGTLFLAGASVSYYLTSPQAAAEGPPAAAVEAAPQRHIITPNPRKPRRMTLDPASFKDPETRQAYQVARDKPALLEKMACYCGCMGSVENHTSNLDCFVDKHGQGCALCRRIAIEAAEMHERGVSVEAIKREIDNRYAK